MKVLVPILVLSLIALPFQAGFCDTGTTSEASTSHHADTAEAGHSCCETDSPGPEVDCGDGQECCPCFLGAAALQDISRLVTAWNTPVFVDINSGIILPSHASPPFRPPIS